MSATEHVRDLVPCMIRLRTTCASRPDPQDRVVWVSSLAIESVLETEGYTRVMLKSGNFYWTDTPATTIIRALGPRSS